MSPYLLPILSIVLGLILIGNGIRQVVEILMMLALFIKDDNKTKITFGSTFMTTLSYAPSVGIILVVIGIRYLP